jgi:hypothetical protein
MHGIFVDNLSIEPLFFYRAPTTVICCIMSIGKASGGAEDKRSTSSLCTNMATSPGYDYRGKRRDDHDTTFSADNIGA